jgi:hypothetical protein
MMRVRFISTLNKTPFGRSLLNWLDALERELGCRHSAPTEPSIRR